MILVGISVECTVCRRTKKPHGRSAPVYSSYCDEGCIGYELDPKPGCLWPREYDYEFGFQVCGNATREVTGYICCICHREIENRAGYDHVCENRI
jgi:hypothetical protein